MTSRKENSCLLNLDCEPKEGSISNFNLHLVAPSQASQTLLSQLKLHLTNYNPKIKLVIRKGFPWTLQLTREHNSSSPKFNGADMETTVPAT